MIHNVNGIMVDINGELFPAVNIWIPADYPNGITNLYFEMLFENGYDTVVYQDEDKTRFTVDICHKDDSYKEIIHTYHCDSEEELIHILNQEKVIHEVNDKFYLEESALADI